MRITPLAFALLVAAAPAPASAAEINLSIPLSLGSMDSVSSQTYGCADGSEIAVQYVNAGANSLAILPMDGAPRIFVNVLSGSGARYQSGADVWWSKGNSATLHSELTKVAPLTCEIKDPAPTE